MRRIIYLVLLLCIPSRLLSQVLPKEGGKLNYRLIGFSCPQIKSGQCTLEIAAGYYNNSDSFNKNIIESIDCETSKKIAEVPAFGKDYTWCMVADKPAVKDNDLHHFSTLMSPKVDISIKRLIITKQATQYKDAYIFIDGLQALYDMQGNAVWFLPGGIFSNNMDSSTRDLKLSPQGGITFLTADNIYEIDYNVNILWKGPNTGKVGGDTSENYHHEFTRLANGHYMVMGRETVAWKLSNYKKDSLYPIDNVTMHDDHKFYQRMSFETVIEYDEKGKVVWSWKSSQYFKKSDLFNYTTEYGKFVPVDTHENSFFFDKKTNSIYVDFKGINRIVKVKYPEGTVMAVYGNKYKLGIQDTGEEMFSGEHSIKISQEGYMYLYNNNTSIRPQFPTVIMMQESQHQKSGLKKKWEYVCSVEDTSGEKERFNNDQQKKLLLHKRHLGKPQLTSGGNVIELPDQSLFVSMNIPKSKMFIVTRDKKIIWSALPEELNVKDNVWNISGSYRASIIASHKDMEQLIWNAEMKK